MNCNNSQGWIGCYSYKIIVYLILVFCTFNCIGNYPEPQIAFYFWKSNVELDQSDFHYLRKLNTRRIYVRFMDVVYSKSQNKSVPVAVLNIKSGFPPSVEIVPTVYITNEVLKRTESKHIPALSKNILSLIKDISRPLKQKIHEYQMDCDWTLSTRQKYFQLLKEIKNYTNPRNIQISATIRLHQIKYFKKTGVPPVHRGILMYYNIGDLTNPSTYNSIFNLNLAKQYLISIDEYPLDLDVIFPLFSWGVVIRREKPVLLINNIDKDDLNTDQKIRYIDGNRYQVKDEHYFHTNYLYKDDMIRLEEVSPEILIKGFQLVPKSVRRKLKYIAFFHIDKKIQRRYPHEILQRIIHSAD